MVTPDPDDPEVLGAWADQGYSRGVKTGVQRVVLDRLDDMERRIRLVERRLRVPAAQ